LFVCIKKNSESNTIVKINISNLIYVEKNTSKIRKKGFKKRKEVIDILYKN